MTIWDCQTHVRMTSMMSSVEWTDLDFKISVALILTKATENRFFAGPDQFLVFKTDSVCIKRCFFGPKKHTLRIIYWPNYLD